jgi:hypothetical protein
VWAKGATPFTKNKARFVKNKEWIFLKNLEWR